MSSPSARSSRPVFGGPSFDAQRADGKVSWHRWLLLWPFHAAAALVMTGYRWVSSEPLASKVDSGA